ncbi:MAG: SEC-C metal-binding domain-containing protein [archaeon]
MKTGRNEPCPCGSGKKYKKCCLDEDMEKSNLTGESLPVHKCWISNTPGSKIVVISRLKPNGNFEMASMLVDGWKMGLKDGFGNLNMTNDQLDEYIYSQDFKVANLDDCKKLIKNGILIAKDLNLKLPKEFVMYKDIIGNMDDIKIEGSLYKCFSCGKGNLGEDVIKKIKEITINDIKRGACGSMEETIIYFVCDKCKIGDKND